MSRRIWIDITDFLKWQGNFTAFQHIQYNIAKLYIESGKDVVFFIYNESARRFEQVAFDPDVFANNGVRSNEQTYSTTARKLLHVAKRLTPKPIKSAAKKLLGRESGKVSGATPMVDSPFKKGDVVVVLGGIWHGSFAADMTNQKQQKGFKFIHVVHDMVPVVCPQCVVEDLSEVFAAYKDKIFRIADGLMINSKSSKKDAIAFMKQRGIKVPDSIVFRLADERLESAKPEAVPGLKPDKFLLSFGTVEGRKNHMLLYYVYKQATREGIDLPKMVIAGRRGWLIDDLFYMIDRDPEVRDKFVILDGVPNTQRSWLFEYCLFTVWTSFYEGWGMPVAESLTYGKLCLSSDTASMPEIGGDLVEYFSPFNSKECLRLIQKYLDTSTREAKEKRIRKEYTVTTWRDMYRTMSEFIDKV